MRVVIHDEESLEPITVVTLPGLTEMNLEKKRHWRVSVHDGANEPREMGRSEPIRTVCALST